LTDCTKSLLRITLRLLKSLSPGSLRSTLLLVSRLVSEFIHLLTHLAAAVGISIPGCRTTERIEENAHGGEVELSDEAIREIRQLVDKAVVVGTRNRTVLDRDRSGGQLSPARPVEGRELCMTHDYIVLAIYSTSIEQGPE
jgi:hypothetical protein